MIPTKKIASLLFLLGSYGCFSQRVPQYGDQTTASSKTANLKKSYEERQQLFSDVFENIDIKKYDDAIAQARKIVAASISNKDTVNLRDAYRMLSKAYHYKEDIKQRDNYEKLIKDLSVAFGYHVDEGLAAIEKKDYGATNIYDEIDLLEDRKGQLTYAAVSPPSFQNSYIKNFTVPAGDDTYSLREPRGYASTDPKILFNQDAVYWIKFKIVGSATKKGKYLFHIGQNVGGSWDKIELYVQSPNKAVQHFRFGLALSPATKDFKYNHNLFDLILEKNEVKTLYMRLEGARKDNSLTWRPNFIALSLMDSKSFLEFDGYYHVPDSIAHMHYDGQPRMLNHILNALNFIEDPNQKYSLHDVVHNWDKLDPEFPYELTDKKPSAYYWARLRLVNKAKNTSRHSFMLPEVWDDVAYYIPDSTNTYKRHLTGTNIPVDRKTIPGLYNIIRVTVKYNDTITIYLKFKSNKLFINSSTGLTKFEVAHIDETALWRDHITQYLPNYILIGVLLIQFLYYLINFLINKERTHFYLMMFFFSLLLFFFNGSNILSQFQSNIALRFFASTLAVVGLFKYTETILNIRGLSRWLHKANIVILGIALLSLLSLIGNLTYHNFFEPLSASSDMSTLYFVNFIVLLAVMIILFLEAIYAAIKRVKYANFFLLFFALIFASLFAPSLIPSSWNATTDQIAAFCDALLALSTLGLMLITAYRLKQLRKDQAEKEKAQASERAKHQFLANMSHEIRTPMNAIKGMTDILIRRNPKEDQKEYLDTIKQSSDSLLVIINDILDISKIEAGKIELEHEPFSVNDVVDNVHTIMQFKAEEKGLELKKNIPAETIYVGGDSTRLRQILINLIGNAIKFTEKGVVTTTVTSEQIADKINVHFTVSDTGIGIAEDRMEIIFKSFEQAYSDTSRKFGGTGLGLSISRKLVELHNGKIWVESDPGQGTQFHLTIPYNVAETVAQELHSDYTDNHNAEKLKGISILLVEDNPFNAVVAQEELEDAIEGVNVIVAENGLIALEQLNSSHFDIILMDVQMPTMNGYEATKTIRLLANEKATTPIIAMTANVFKEEVDACHQAGMNDFIGKPFDTNELLQKIYNNLKNKTHDQ